MSVARLMNELQESGIRFSAEGEFLVATGPETKLTEALRGQLIAHKQAMLKLCRSSVVQRAAELIARLPEQERRKQAWDCFNERAAVAEEGGLSKLEAERLALKELAILPELSDGPAR